MGRMFGTDGIRGIANVELTAELAFKVGQCGAYVLTRNADHRPRILIGKDTRKSGDMLEAALTAGMCSVGAKVIPLGVIPTPAVAYLTRLYKADAGVVISASHNPCEYNGIKFFNSEGYKLSDSVEDEIEAYIRAEKKMNDLPTHGKVGYVSANHNAVEDYVNFACSTIDCDLRGMKIAIDCANGASYQTAFKALNKLGANVEAIHNTPDGVNINAKCGSTHMESLQSYVTSIGADIGLAFDGDADRMLAVDENGKIIDGDQIMAVCAKYMLENNKLKQNTLVATVMSNLGLFIAGEKLGINIPRTKVGDRYVLEEMLDKGYSIGGEQSGHIIFLEHNTTGDGLVSALQFLSVLKKTSQKASEAASIVEVLPQVLVNATVKPENKEKYMEVEEIAEACKKVEEKFAGEGRVLIRPSGTEPLVRVMIEGKDKDVLQAEAEKLASLIEKILG
ncbi:MAG TPA: phosphoglucosamine mutase [Candidatus Ornithomonoglobus merdipullorum]|uniref:Phosphoglucosamine mutase n=1 Tax=Candidatus Ornithomonoglobus merdipullorum TaxID=2840895 RepID=A0A9D1SF18_9FIRM|nr:phosphoglucosamine mutase [Candidatus Ornithomonoglobus merdipullorum]